MDSTYKNAEFFDQNIWNVVIREDRNIYGGGIIIATLRKYAAAPVIIKYDDEETNPELYWIKLETFNRQKPIYICGLYRSQRDIRSAKTLNCLQESLEKLPGKKSQRHILVAGDFNLHINWETERPMANSFTKNLDEEMIEIAHKNNLEQQVKFSTRKENTLDLFFTSEPSKIVKVSSTAPISDHDLIVVDLNLCVKKKPKSQHIIYNWKKANVEEINKLVSEKLKNINQNQLTDVEASWNNFKNVLLEAQDKFVPHRLSTSRHNLPWFNQKLRRLAKKKQRLYNKAKKTKTNDDMTAFKKCRGEYSQCLRKAQRQYYNDFLEPKIDENAKYMFNYIKRLKKDSVGIEALNYKGKITTDAKEKAKALADQYESVYAKEDPTDIPNILPSPYPTMPDIEISEKGVLAQLERLNKNKSVGPDGLSPHLLKMLSKTIAPTLTTMYKESLLQNKIPMDWKRQFITPILKPGKDKLDPASYRPVSITCICSKILEHIIYSETMNHLQTHGILSKFQHGYREGCSIETQLLKVIDLFTRGLENGKQVDAIALDFKTAFDSVPHQRMLLKLEYYGIRKLNPWIRDFMNGRTQHVLVEGVKSRLIQVISGISQGTVISALLFLIFINDLPESVKKSFTGLFCDDTLMAKEIHNNNDATELQKDLEAVEEWSKMWGMQFNTLKSEVMTITNVRKPIETTYNLSGKDLDKKESIKYLGVWIDNKLSFKKHIEEKVKKSKTVLNMLRRNLLFAPKSVKAKAYISTVRPIIETASICWSPSADKYKKMIEGVQHSAAQFVANYYPKKGKYEEYSISKLIKELGWTPLEERRNQAKLIMAYKILNNKVILNPESLPKKQYARPPRSCNLATVGAGNELEVPDARLDTTRNTFFFSVPALWNNLVSPEQANAPSVEAFKRHFSNRPPSNDQNGN